MLRYLYTLSALGETLKQNIIEIEPDPAPKFLFTHLG